MISSPADLTRCVRGAVVASMTGLFSHGPTALEHTLDNLGDQGLLGPDSVSWRVLGDAAVFIGGIRALLVQSAHPEVVAGVEDHSTYRSDPLGRLSRTSVYVTETTYGSMPQVEAAVKVVRHAHQPVTGTSERNRAYSASRPELAAWVHNVPTDSFLASFQAFGPKRLSTAEADRFVAEQALIGELLGAAPLPKTEAALAEWILNHPDRGTTTAQTTAIGFLRKPPLSPPVKIAYRLLFDAAVHTIPAELQTQLRLTSSPQARTIGTSATGTLRWALGASPAWQLALIRCGAPVPAGLFRQALPADLAHDG
ncbi:MAG: hypothetical protein ACI8TP_001835 [Acidimicrobiales bacterium]|jgi:uncharacterized protein (DUF2236 family)